MRKIHSDVFIGALLLLFSVGVLVLAEQMPGNTNQFPVFVACVLAAFSAMIVFSGIKKTKLALASGDVEKVFRNTGYPIIVYGVICGYIALIDFVGFFVSTILFVPVLMFVYANTDIRRIIGVIVGICLFVYCLFEWQLGIRLPSGFLV